MATKTTKAEPERRKLAQELLGLERKHKSMFARYDGIKARLRELATEAGESFQEMFANRGAVKVSAGHSGKFKGTFPLVQEKAYFDLSDERRKKLDDDGIVKMVPVYGGPYAGSVTVNIFEEKAA